MIALAVFVLIMSPQAAHAAALACNGAGGVAAGTLFEADPNAGTGACATINPPLEHVFSLVICAFVIILNDVLGAMYCGIQFSMQGILALVLTLYVAVFGAQILMGTAQMNSKEVITRLLKIAGVWTFATQSLWGINLAFGFFVSLITNGVWWVTSSIMPAAIGNIGNSVMPVYAFLDNLIYTTVTGPATDGGAKLIGFFGVMLNVLPTLSFLAASWLWMTLITLARTLISFMLAVAAIAFLIALSPIFLSFMLFQSTFHLFESWLRYMLSYSVQIIIVFAIIALWVHIVMMFAGFFDMLGDLLFPFKALGVPGAFTDPNNTWAICREIDYGMSPVGPTAVCNPVLGANPPPEALLQPSKIPEQTDFIYFCVFHLISLSLIAYAFNALMRDAPEIAKHIVGPAYAPVLVGGWGQDAMSWLGKRVHRGQLAGLDSNTARQRLDNVFEGGNASAPSVDYFDKMKSLVEKRK